MHLGCQITAGLPWALNPIVVSWAGSRGWRTDTSAGGYHGTQRGVDITRLGKRGPILHFMGTQEGWGTACLSQAREQLANPGKHPHNPSLWDASTTPLKKVVKRALATTVTLPDKSNRSSVGWLSVRDLWGRFGVGWCWLGLKRGWLHVSLGSRGS